MRKLIFILMACVLAVGISVSAFADFDRGHGGDHHDGGDVFVAKTGNYIDKTENEKLTTTTDITAEVGPYAEVVWQGVAPNLDFEGQPGEIRYANRSFTLICNCLVDVTVSDISPLKQHIDGQDFTIDTKYCVKKDGIKVDDNDYKTSAAHFDGLQDLGIKNSDPVTYKFYVRGKLGDKVTSQHAGFYRTTATLTVQSANSF